MENNRIAKMEIEKVKILLDTQLVVYERSLAKHNRLWIPKLKERYSY